MIDEQPDILDRVNVPISITINDHLVETVFVLTRDYHAIGKALIGLDKIYFEKREEARACVLSLVVAGASVTIREPIPVDTQYLLQRFVDYFYRIHDTHQWKAPIDPMLSLCYGLLATKRITRDESFELARRLLGVDAPKSANSWRVRVDAFAKTRGLDPIGQPKRRRWKLTAK